ncbi:MAG: hypothetical protein ABI333_22035 [bacterium]
MTVDKRLLISVGAVVALTLVGAQDSQARSAGVAVWRSGPECTQAVKAGKRLARSGADVRVGTWNLHGFPDGAPGRRRPKGTRTDVDWLACSIAWMQVDVLALQGVKNHWQAKAALGKLLKGLRQYTGATWKVKLDRCGGANRDHVGLLWNTGRLRGSKFQVEEYLNPYRKACSSGQRPGLRGYFKRPGGVDFHLLSVQLPAGASGLDSKLRKRAVSGIPDAYRSANRSEPDPDLLVAGDLQTSATGWLARAVSSLRPPFLVAPSDRSCTFYDKYGPSSLSHLLVSRGFVEVQPSRRARVSGYCAVVACSKNGAEKPMSSFHKLSPHCPVLLDVPNRDVDPTRQELGAWATNTYTVKTGKSGLPRKLSAEMIKSVLRKLKPRLYRSCRKHGSAAYQVTILGASGKVHKVAPEGKAPRCATRVLKKAVFPRFQISAIEILIPVVW